MAVENPAPARPPSLSLWLAVLAPPVAWAVQLVAGYGSEEAGCDPSGRTSTWLSVGPDGWALAVSLVGLAVAALALATGLRNLGRGVGEGPQRFLAAAAVLSALVFLVTLAIGTGALLAIDACEAG